MTVLDQLLTEHFGDLGLADHGLSRGWETVLLTPRFVTSRHVIGLVHPAGAARPTVVAKIPRRRGDLESVQREAAILRSLGQDVAGRAPVVLGLVQTCGHSALVETAVDGTPLDPELVRADPDAALDAGLHFLGQLPVTASATQNSAWYRSCVVEPLQQLLSRVGDDADLTELVGRTHRALRPLAEQPLPSVLEHGDLSHPNLLRGKDGELRALDWERAQMRGLPGHDLVFFVQYVAESVAQAFDLPAQVTVWDLWWGPGGRGSSLLVEWMRRFGVAADRPELWSLLSMVRTASTLGGRLADSDPDRAAAVAAVRSDRDVLLWRHALATVEGQL